MIISNKNSFIRNVILRWYKGESINPYQEIVKLYPNLKSWEPNDFSLKYMKYIILHWNDGTSKKIPLFI